MWQVVSNDDSIFKEPYPPSSDSFVQGDGPNVGLPVSILMGLICVTIDNGLIHVTFDPQTPVSGLKAKPIPTIDTSRTQVPDLVKHHLL